MARLHLFEWEDQPWFPAPVRDAGTDFLQFMLHAGDNYAPAAPLLARAIRRSGARRVVDLCSGGGGPWRRMLPALAAHGAPVSLLLTDRFPNPGAAERVAAGAGDGAEVEFHPRPVDATQMPPGLDGFRTLFSSFHHFAPGAARALLADAVRERAPIGVFEATRRNALGLALMLPSPLLVLLATPWIRPLRWSRLLLTYLLPAVPLMVLWDGTVSCLRSYTPAELRALVDTVPGAETYRWEIGEVRGRAPIPVTYLIGLPRGAAGDEDAQAASAPPSRTER